MKKPTTLRFLSWRAVSDPKQAKRKVSSGDEIDKESLPDQRRRNAEFVDNLSRYYPGYHGILVTELEFVGTRDILIDEALEFPQYQEMVRLVRDGEIDAIVCRSRDRLGRDVSITSYLDSLCRRHRVIIVSRESNRPSTLDFDELDQNVARPVVDAVDSSLGQVYLRQFVALSRKGVQERMLVRGLFRGKPPFGYVVQNGEVFIDEDKAKFVRIALGLYADGYGGTYIAKHMQSIGAVAPSGTSWNLNTFYKIVNKIHLYAGHLYANHRSKYVRTPSMVENTHPPIISQDVYQRCLAAKKRKTYTLSKRALLLSGIVFCSFCKKVVVYGGHGKFVRRGGESVVRMGCNNPNCTVKPSVVVHKVTAGIRDSIREFAATVTMDQYIEQYREITESHDDYDRLIAHCESELRSCKAKRERTVEMYIDGIIRSKDDLSARLSSIDEEIRLLTDKSEELSVGLSSLKAVSSENLKAVYREILDNAEQVLFSGAVDIAAANWWLRRYVRVSINGGGRYDSRIDRVAFGDFSLGDLPWM